jgi:uncharacterized protein (DUF58 family)
MREQFILLVSILLTATSVFAQPQVTFKTTTSTETVASGEPFELTFRLENAQAPDLQLPDLPNLEIIGEPTVSQSIAIANGQKSQILTFQYAVQAIVVGELVIPSIKITTSNGLVLQSAPIKISVTEGNRLGVTTRGVANGRRTNKLR